MSIKISPITTLPDFDLVVTIQQAVWGPDDLEIVPSHMLKAVSERGGLTLGSWLGNSLVGFVFSVPAFETPILSGGFYYLSHMAAVLPEYQNQGIGAALKRAQWQAALERGIKKIVWTFDPLLSRNAYFNIVRLGGICTTYHTDFYSPEPFNGQKIPSDRFDLTLNVNDARVQEAMSDKSGQKLSLDDYFSQGAEVVNPIKFNAAGFPLVPDQPWIMSELSATLGLAPLPEDLSPDIYLVEIPADYPAIRMTEPALALKWRLHSRALFTELFARGYLATDFIHIPGSPGRSFYIISKSKGENL